MPRLLCKDILPLCNWTIFKYFEDTFYRWGKEAGAEEYIYPDLMDIDTLKKINYISQFPHHILFASHVKEDMDVINPVKTFFT